MALIAATASRWFFVGTSTKAPNKCESIQRIKAVVPGPARGPRLGRVFQFKSGQIVGAVVVIGYATDDHALAKAKRSEATTAEDPAAGSQPGVV